MAKLAKTEPETTEPTNQKGFESRYFDQLVYKETPNGWLAIYRVFEKESGLLVHCDTVFVGRALDVNGQKSFENGKV